MRRALWRLPIIGLAVGSLALVGGTTIGGDLGPLAAGYGVLVGLAALYGLIGLAVRERVWRRLGSARVERVAGHRLF